ncbi:MAG: NAD(P)(+) transhydrogenase (Re/Si-specific) subunit alpha, partial [Actinobacteria bacterium]|nr:NAD(P)(+) transhydrogenase (Re/Si-specific) subunit alpha [Actinomycetota bacterium]
MAVIGIVREPAGEARVAATPATIAQLRKLGHEVVVERGAGSAASYPDEAYAAAGATLVEREQAWGSEIVLAITAPAPEQIALLSDGATFIALLSPALRPDLVESLAQRGITALALDAVPRISRAQSMDVLSSMANIAGYRAVVEAAHEFGRFFTGQVTA